MADGPPYHYVKTLDIKVNGSGEDALFGQPLGLQIFKEAAGGVGGITKNPERLLGRALPDLLPGVGEGGAEAAVGVFHFLTETGLGEEGADVQAVAVIFEAKPVTAPDVGDEFVPGGHQAVAARADDMGRVAVIFKKLADFFPGHGSHCMREWRTAV